MNADQEKAGSQTTFTDHLIELRSRLIKIMLVLVILVVALSPFLSEILTYVAKPMINSLPIGSKMSVTGVLEGIIIPLKVLLTSALVMSLPFTLYQVWSFVAPGLYRHEKKFALGIIVSSVLLFFLGMCFCYFVFFPLLFSIAATFTPQEVAFYIPTISSYISFILNMFVVFGIAFQVPIIMFVLNKIGIVSLNQLKKFRGYAIIAAFAIAAITTPPDIISQFLLAIPLVLLYELGILSCRFNTQPAIEHTNP